MNHIRTLCPENARLTLINLDETAVRYFHGENKGNVIKKAIHPEGSNEKAAQISRKDLRACITHVALVAEDPEVQQVLPPWILGNTNVMLKRDVTAAQADVGPNIRFIRGKSGWTNVTVMVALLKAIASAVRSLEQNRFIVLLLDCARQHLHDKISRCARSVKIHLVYVPAKLTWLLQPCDTHVFLKYKRRLAELYADDVANYKSGKQPYSQWLRRIGKCIVDVLESSPWSKAFAETGWTKDQMECSLFVLRHLDPSTMLPASEDPIATDDIKQVLPHNIKLSFALLKPRAAETVPVLLDDAHGSLPHCADTVAVMTSGAGTFDIQSAVGEACVHGHASAGFSVTGSHPSTAVETAPLRRCPPMMPPADGTVLAAAAMSSTDGPISRRTRSKSFASASGC